MAKVAKSDGGNFAFFNVQDSVTAESFHNVKSAHLVMFLVSSSWLTRGHEGLEKYVQTQSRKTEIFLINKYYAAMMVLGLALDGVVLFPKNVCNLEVLLDLWLLLQHQMETRVKAPFTI